MWAKILILILAIGFILFGFFYYATNTSYSLSSEARTLYEMGKYDEAIDLAQIAYKKDNYNRMAFTVISQSKEAKKWLKFMDESKKFLEKSKELSEKRVISKADRYEMKIMAELVMEEYLKLGKENPMVDKKKKKEAELLFKQFKKIYDELTKE